MVHTQAYELHDSSATSIHQEFPWRHAAQALLPTSRVPVSTLTRKHLPSVRPIGGWRKKVPANSARAQSLCQEQARERFRLQPFSHPAAYYISQQATTADRQLPCQQLLLRVQVREREEKEKAEGGRKKGGRAADPGREEKEKTRCCAGPAAGAVTQGKLQNKN